MTIFTAFSRSPPYLPITDFGLNAKLGLQLETTEKLHRMSEWVYEVFMFCLLSLYELFDRMWTVALGAGAWPEHRTVCFSGPAFVE
jgi:hypothetical protein